MSQLKLMRTLKFTTEDLRTNRDGGISQTQRERFEPAKMNPIIMLTMLGHLVLISGIIVVLALITGSKVMWGVLVVVVLMTAMPFGWLQEANRTRPVVLRDVHMGKVSKACGIIVLQEKAGRKTSFDLLVDGVVLPLTASEASSFQNEGSYCVYYLPESKTLLSAELSH